jgi:hypothetical protein
MDYRSIGAGTESGGRGTASELGICAGPIFRLADGRERWTQVNTQVNTSVVLELPTVSLYMPVL